MGSQQLNNVVSKNYNHIPALLIGNGINRLTNNSLSWEGVINKLINTVESPKIKQGNKPLTFLFEEILHAMDGGATRENEEKLKKIVSSTINQNLAPNDLHKKIMSLRVEHFLTPNYDYCLEKAIDPHFKKIKVKKQEGESKKYSTSRFNRVGNKFIWHIHGELDNGLIGEKNNYSEKSIMLGFDQYMGNLREMTQLLNSGSYRNRSDENTLEEVFTSLLSNETKERSWMSFFFTHDIHILGLEIGFEEIHIWWLLHYRAKLANVKRLEYKNRIIYYVSSYDRLLKRDRLELLESLGVYITEIQCDYNKGDFYKEFYEKVYELICLAL